MGKLVYTVTTAGAAAGAMTSGNPNSNTVQGPLPYNAAPNGYLVGSIVPDTHPMVQQWLAAAYITQISL